MRCEICKQLLHALRSGTVSSSQKAELKEHLLANSRCREEFPLNAEITALLNDLHETMKQAPLSFGAMRSRVEQTLGKTRTTLLPLGITGSIAAVLLVVVISMLSLKPTVSADEYEVSIEGVEPHLVENNEVICDLLETNGLIEAGYDVTGCQKTCAVVIYNLKTKQEAELVVKLFHQLAQEHISSEIIPI